MDVDEAIEDIGALLHHSPVLSLLSNIVYQANYKLIKLKAKVR